MFATMKPFSGSAAFGSASSALMPQITVVLPSFTIADPSAVLIEFRLIPVGRYCWKMDPNKNFHRLPGIEIYLQLPAVRSNIVLQVAQVVFEGVDQSENTQLLYNLRE